MFFGPLALLYFHPLIDFFLYSDLISNFYSSIFIGCGSIFGRNFFVLFFPFVSWDELKFCFLLRSYFFNKFKVSIHLLLLTYISISLQFRSHLSLLCCDTDLFTSFLSLTYVFRSSLPLALIHFKYAYYFFRFLSPLRSSL